VVTSAAIVMVFVFSIFATLSMLMFKQFGVGLAAAILIDATIVRGVLLPATMKLLGEWNWYLPGGSSGCRASSPTSDAVGGSGRSGDSRFGVTLARSRPRVCAAGIDARAV
jgi:MMPL family protein